MLKQLFAFFNIIMLKIERSVPGAEQNFLECPEREREREREWSWNGAKNFAKSQLSDPAPVTHKQLTVLTGTSYYPHPHFEILFF